MAMSQFRQSLLILFISVLLLSKIHYSIQTALEDITDDYFLESDDNTPTAKHDYSNLDDLDDGDSYSESDPYQETIVDEKDVVILRDGNFSDFVSKNRYVMVEFYAPWCGHCQALAPEYAAAATELKGDAVLAKGDGTEENELAMKFDIQGFPTVYFFIDGVRMSYEGQRTKDAIVNWVKKKMGPGVYNITTVAEAEQVLAKESKLVLGFLDSLVGPDSKELDAASQFEDDIKFYQTDNPDVAKLFHIESHVKRPALVLLKNETEKLSYFNDNFSKSALAEFVSANKHPLVITFTRESASLVFENPIKRQLILFATSNDAHKVIPSFKEVAQAFKGKIVFVFVEMDNDDYGESVSDHFGITGDRPRLLAYTGNDDARKFILEGELTLSSMKLFAEEFLEDKLKPFYKSDQIPQTNNEDVKVVVGNNFDDIVLDESKDVLLEIYAPWCGHCQSLEPTYNKLAKYLRAINSIVIAKMDGTTNEHPRAKPDGFPTLLFFPAGSKSFDPITVDTDRTVVAFYKFLKKHASIPFKLQKPDSTKKIESSESADVKIVKDEL